MGLKFNMPSVLIRRGEFGHRDTGARGRRPYEEGGRE